MISCSNTNKSDNKSDEDLKSVETFDWLLGNWQRNNEQEDRETFEIWNKKDSTEYYGLGFTLQNSDTISQEKIKLIKTDNEWNLEVIGMGESNPTIFKLTKIGKDEFICENEQIEFPKKIQYLKIENNIKAIVSGDDAEIIFVFEKVSE